jgi:hypothetical protein
VQQPTKASQFAEAVVACIGCALIGAAAAANQPWFDHHVLPSFWTPRQEIVQGEQMVRFGVAIAGALIALLLRKRIARLVAKEPLFVITIPLAIVLAMGTAELALRHRFPHVDPAVDWLATAPTRHDRYLGEDISYALDRNGYRVASPTSTVDFNAPTIVFAGESMMVGLKLQWSDTIPAQTSEMLGVRSANIAIPGLDTDEIYQRLKSELPRFRRPVAVVSLFAPSLFDRNLDGQGRRWRLAALAQHLIPYRGRAEIERGIAATRRDLTAMVQLARARGAVPLIVVPEFGAEQPGERELRRRILDDAHLPYVRVTVDPDDRVENDGHPDSDGARTIARAIAGALASRLVH